MNARKSSLLALIGLLATAAPAAAQTGNIRGLPTGQAVYNNGYYGAAPSYAYAAPQAVYYAPGYRNGYPVQQAVNPQGVAVAPSAQAARVAYYAPPTVAYYAPSSPGYAVSPAGGASAGAEAFAYYGLQQRLNYVPPTYYYQTRMVPVPVTYYRPVTVYQPGTGVATTCQRACTTTQCQPQRFRLFNWFCGNSCNSGATNCNYGSCAPATGCAPAAVPYYNTAPANIVPATPATPSRGFNNILTPRTTVPPPGTGVIGGPADNQPFISPSTPIPGSPPAIRGTVPGASPPSSFGTPSGGGFGTGSGASTPGTGTAPVYGSTFRSNFDKPKADIQLSRPTITEPGLKPRVSDSPSTLRPVADPEAGQRAKPGSRAPALINPNDKTARVRAFQPLGAATWDVVPARWPEKRQKVNYKVQTAAAEVAAENASAARQDEKWDDSGWKSAR